MVTRDVARAVWFRLIAVLCGLIAVGPLCIVSPLKPPDPSDADAKQAENVTGTRKPQRGIFEQPTTLWLLFFTIFVFNISAELVFGVWATTFAEVSGLVPKNEAPLVATTFYWCYTSFRILTAFVSSCVSPTTLIFVGCEQTTASMLTPAHAVIVALPVWSLLL